MPENPLPPLPAFKRGVEAIEIQHEGKPMVLLRDQEGLRKDSVVVTPPAFFIAMMLDGRATATDVQTVYSKATGSLISPADIENIIREFDKAELLETPHLQERRKQVLGDFLKNSIRPAHLKGAAYPETVLDLAVELGVFFKNSKGPGKELFNGTPLTPAPLGVVAPHIDFRRGGPAYAWAYQALSECRPPDVIVALGVAHVSPNSPWVMTPKEYETPYGAMTVDKTIYNDIQSSLWYGGQDDEWAHRTEHSLEFQALWLKYIWRDKTPPWVPILCSSFDRFALDRAPSTVESIEKAIQTIGEKLKARQAAGQKIMILAGVDMAHVGPRFGDDMKVDGALKEKIEKEDRPSMDLLLKGDADAFYMSVVKDGHWRKWCGLSALYTSLRLMKILSPDHSTGQLLSYDQAEDPMGGIVSFASAIFR